MSGNLQKQLKSIAQDRNRYRGIGHLLYAAAIAFFEIMFLIFLWDAFPDNPLVQALAGLGSITVGITAALMPVFKNKWFSTDGMNNFGLLFWVVEIGVMFLNLLLSFEIAKGITEGGMWSWWKSFSPASPILVIVGIGVLLMIDPEHKRRQDQLKFDEDMHSVFHDGIMEYVESEGVQAELRHGAQLAARKYITSHIASETNALLNNNSTLPNETQEVLPPPAKGRVGRPPKNDTILTINGNGNGAEPMYDPDEYNDVNSTGRRGIGNSGENFR